MSDEYIKISKDEYEALKAENLSLKCREKELNLAVDSMRIGIAYVSKDRLITQVNDNIIDIFGYSSPDELIGQSVSIIHINDDVFSSFGSSYFNSLEKRGFVILEHQMKRKDGSIFWCEMFGRAVDDNLPADMNLGVIWGVRDISEKIDYIEEIDRVNADSENQIIFMQSLIDAIPVPIFYKGADSRFLGFNEEYERVFATHREELVGKRVLDLEYLSDADKVMYQAEDEHIIATSGSIRREQLMPYYDNKLHDTIYYVTGIKKSDGSPAGLVSTFIDVTEIKESKRKAEELSEAKGQFLANMSHEIRTPLNGIIGLNKLLLNTPLGIDQKKYVQKAIQSSVALLGIINDILDYSKIEAKKIELSPYELTLDDIFRNTVDLFEFSIIERGLEMHIDSDKNIPRYVIADGLRISQIINNLVGNAIKFTHSGDITIRSTLIGSSGDEIELRVDIIDSGIGMSEAEQERLFSPFTQTDASNTRKYGGTGLGLVITKELVELMGGKIWVESTKGVGSTFSFTMKMMKSYSSDDELFSAERFKNSTFLVVDDNDIEREIVGDLLRSWEINPLLCDNGASAIEILKNKRVDYLLVDWKMPEIDGLDVIESIMDTQSIPKIVMISASLKEELSEAAKLRGIMPDAILHKPITSSMLLETLIDKDEAMSIAEIAVHIKFSGSVLLAEDNEVNQLVAKDLLGHMGIEVDIADDGAIAVEMAKKRKYDLILMDLQMPNMDGFAATRAIREFDKDIAVVALSAAVMDQDKLQATESGMNEHLAKPIDEKALKVVLKKYLEIVSQDVMSSSSEVEYDIEGIDFSVLSRIYNSSDRIKDILGIYAKTQRDFCIKLEKQEIVDGFKASIHALKGSSANIGAKEIQQLCIEIENSENSDELQPLIDRLYAKLSKLIIDINAFISQASNEHHDVIEIDLDELESKLSDSEFIEYDEKIALLEYLKSKNIATSVIEKISDSIDMFEYDSAIEILADIKKDLGV